MKKNNNHTDIYTHLTQEELLEYNRGVLGNDEMYRLELHLNECELCSDALEGVEVIKQPEQILASINTQIIPSDKNKSNLNYLAIAASISLIAVFGLSYWLLTSSNKDNAIALNTPAETETEIVKEDKNEEEVDKLIPETTKDGTEVDIIESEVETNTPTLNQPAPKPILEQKPTISSEKVEEVSIEEEFIASNSIDQEEKEFEDDNDQLNEIVTEPTDASQGVALEPAPMAARSVKKASGDTQLRLTDQKEPIPIGGMAALKKYISSNLTYPQEALDNKIKGTVVLEVTIALDGSIKNMVVNKSIGYGCDAEAKRLISSGPKWTPAVIEGNPVESQQQVKVKFKN